MWCGATIQLFVGLWRLCYDTIYLVIAIGDGGKWDRKLPCGGYLSEQRGQIGACLQKQIAWRAGSLATSVLVHNVLLVVELALAEDRPRLTSVQH